VSELVRIQPTSSVIETPDGEQSVLEISLGGVPRGLVLLLCDQGGLEQDAVEMMNSLAEQGYESLAAELTARLPASTGPTDPMSVDVVARALSVFVSRADERGWTPEQTGVIGIGLGGRAALAAASRLELAAAVSVSPTVEPDASSTPAIRLHEAIAAVRTPWLGMFGGMDESAPDDEIRWLAASLHNNSEVYTEVVTYAGVGRDFYRQAGTGVSYAASYDGWQRTLEWLNARVAPRLTPLALRWRRRRLAHA
jgi:carboxymethylenebutenolidase